MERSFRYIDFFSLQIHVYREKCRERTIVRQNPWQCKRWLYHKCEMIHWNQFWTWKMKWNTKAIQNWMHSERVKSSYKCDNFICIFFPPFAVQKRNSLGCEIQFRRIKTDSMQRFIQFSYTCGLVRSTPSHAYIHLPFVHSTVLIRCVLFHGTFIEIMTLSLNHRLNVQLKSIRYTQKKNRKNTHTTPA